MPAAEVRAVPFEQLDLLVGEHEGGVRSALLEPQQALVTGLQIVSRSHTPRTPEG